jgi:hypothetical protein
MQRWSQVPLVRQVQLGARSKWARQTAALVTLLLVLPVAALAQGSVEDYHRLDALSYRVYADTMCQRSGHRL